MRQDDPERQTADGIGQDPENNVEDGNIPKRWNVPRPKAHDDDTYLARVSSM